MYHLRESISVAFVSDTYISPDASVLNISVTFDENLNFIQDISKTCRRCLYHIRDFRLVSNLTTTIPLFTVL